MSITLFIIMQITIWFILFPLYLYTRKVSRELDRAKGLKERDIPNRQDESSIVGASLFNIADSKTEELDRFKKDPIGKVIDRSEIKQSVESNSVTDSGIIPKDELDDSFQETPEPMDIDYPIEYENDDIGSIETDSSEEEIDDSEDIEDIAKYNLKEDEFAGGSSYEDLQNMSSTISDKSKVKTDTLSNNKAARLLTQLEGTDLYEKMITSNNSTITKRIKSLIKHHTKDNNQPQQELEEENKNHADFEMAYYLNKQ